MTTRMIKKGMIIQYKGSKDDYWLVLNVKLPEYERVPYHRREEEVVTIITILNQDGHLVEKLYTYGNIDFQDSDYVVFYIPDND